MRPRNTTRFLLAALVLGLALALAPVVSAQGCAMCRENAAATADGGRSINLAILVLLVPTLTFFIGIVVFGLRRNDADSALEEQQGRLETVSDATRIERPAPFLGPRNPSVN